MIGRRTSQDRCGSLDAMLLAVLLCVGGCAAGSRTGAPVPIRYVGSSTVALFLRDAEPAFGRAIFHIDTEPESEGGEEAMMRGSADLAGVARRPRPEVLRDGVVATLIGRDAIAVIVNNDNPVHDISRSDLRDVFTGKKRNWRELGGPDLPIVPHIVGEDSATRRVFRAAILGDEQYATGCREIKPDSEIISAVADEPGGIGQISFSFLNGAPSRVRPVSVDGRCPSVTNFEYPIARPLYLLWREGTPGVAAFADWTQSDEGQRIVMLHFVGTRVVGSVRGHAESDAPTGTLVVLTETFPVYDGGIYYYPHLPYDILNSRGALIRHVRNHHNDNDEDPTHIGLPPRTYLIRVETSRGTRPEFYVTIEAGRTTELNVQNLVRRK